MMSSVHGVDWQALALFISTRIQLSRTLILIAVLYLVAVGGYWTIHPRSTLHNTANLEALDAK
jgi:hypothetical protein